MQLLDRNFEKLERLTKRERLGELLVRYREMTLTSLVTLMNEHKFSIHGPFGEFLVDKSLITRHKLLEFLNLQKIQDRVIDSCLEELGYMTNQKKWEKLTRHDKLGEILIRQGKLSLENLINSMKEQAINPEKLIGDILIEKDFVKQNIVEQALETQLVQSSTILKTINEITDISQLPIRVKMNHMSTVWGKEYG